MMNTSKSISCVLALASAATFVGDIAGQLPEVTPADLVSALRVEATAFSAHMELMDLEATQLEEVLLDEVAIDPYLLTGDYPGRKYLIRCFAKARKLVPDGSGNGFELKIADQVHFDAIAFGITFSDSETRLACSRALSECASTHDNVALGLLESLAESDPYWVVREEAVRSIGNFNSMTSRRVTFLNALVRSTGWSGSQQAFWSSQDSSAQPGGLFSLVKPSVVFRSEVMLALCRAGEFSSQMTTVRGSTIDADDREALVRGVSLWMARGDVVSGGSSFEYLLQLQGDSIGFAEFLAYFQDSMDGGLEVAGHAALYSWLEPVATDSGLASVHGADLHAIATDFSAMTGQGPVPYIGAEVLTILVE